MSKFCFLLALALCSNSIKPKPILEEKRPCSSLKKALMEELHRSDFAKKGFGLKSISISKCKEYFLSGLGSKTPLRRIESAAALATLEDSSGLPLLLEFIKPKGFQMPLTNSGIEDAYIKAALLLLNQPLPERLKGRLLNDFGLEEAINECTTQSKSDDP